MASRANSLPELERRLQEKRRAVVVSLDELRGRVRHDVHELSPRQQVKHHAGAALAAAALLGLLAGRVAGGLLRALLR
ncbi:MAG TPA: hypothetical protein VN515_04695 [Terriglobales bacterium]|nr:hypothetical protein [Terriglobales bacterium]